MYLCTQKFKRYNMKRTTNNIKQPSFLQYVRTIIAHERKQGSRKPTTIENHEHALNSLVRFVQEKLQKDDLTFRDITPRLMRQYERYLLHSRKVMRNSSSFYLRNLRMFYNKAVRERKVKTDCHPFDEVYTGVAKTEKRAVGKTEIYEVTQVHEQPSSRKSLYHDIFLFLFLAQGMSFTDLAHLRKQDVAGKDAFIYRRQKTGQEVCVEVTPPLRELIQKYMGRKTTDGYLFPIITSQDPTVAMRQGKKMLDATNRYLNKLGKQLHIQKPLTTYVARHSWATIALEIGCSVSDISMALGHASERTTRVYLKAIHTQKMETMTKKIAQLMVN